MRSTAEVLDHHLKCFAEPDLDAVMADYAARALFFGSDGALRGFQTSRRFLWFVQEPHCAFYAQKR